MTYIVHIDTSDLSYAETSPFFREIHGELTEGERLCETVLKVTDDEFEALPPLFDRWEVSHESYRVHDGPH
jgi:hypothetical protein